jgi:hypothetical protein
MTPTRAFDFTAVAGGTRATAAPVVAAAPIPWGFPELFVISQTALPALLYLPGSQGIRLGLRVSVFAISLAAFAWWQLRTETYPAHRATGWATAVLSLMGVMLFHPSTPSLEGGLAHLMVYLAVLAPLFWAPLFVRTPEHLARLLALVLICSGANSVVGVLQVYDPDRWMPVELSRIITEGALGLGPVTYIGPLGQTIVRPPGLFDTPGAVAGPGMFAALLGAIFGLSAIPLWQRAGAFTLAGAGIAAIYLSQVRVSIVVLVVMFAVYSLVLLMQGRAVKATTFGSLAAGAIVLSFLLAVTLGGQSIVDRFMSLFAEDPVSVYYRARGIQLSYTMSEMLYEFPLGAGLGRWGMAAGYFGTSSVIPTLWAEIQITGWMIDGGVLMIVLYSAAVIATAVAQLRLARLTQYPRVAACAAVVFAANLGIAAMVFSFTPFVTQIGIQYWFLTGALHGVACQYRLHDA